MTETIRCIKDGALGIHLPTGFVACSDHEALIKAGASVEDIALVAEGPDGAGEADSVDHFWEAWNNILRDVSVKDKDGHTWTLHHDGDLFEVRDDHDWGE